MVMILGMMKILLPTLSKSGDDGSDFPPATAADQPFRRWKKGSASAAASEKYGKNKA
jgi:hypothetical protein